MLTAHIHELVVLFGAGLLVLTVCYRLRIPPLIGFLLTGVAVGPSMLGWIHESEQIELFAELGVVFLLFGVGLEVSPALLRSLWRELAIGGSVQFVATTLLVVGIALSLGLTPQLALFAGFVIAMSSTAIVLKIYRERGELTAPHGRIATGVLLFQDLLIVPLLLLVPILAGEMDVSGAVLLRRLGGGALAVAAAFWLGRWLLPPLLDLVARTRIPELLVIGSLFACLGGAELTEWLGFSPALGAFLAGVLIAESDYHHQALAEVGPFRDVFNSVFFISVGMLVSLDYAVSHLPMVLALGLGVIVLKALCVALAVTALRFPWRTKILAAIGLAQIGELSFVLVRRGLEAGLLDDGQYQLAVASTIVTMVGTPLLIGVAPRLASGWRRSADEPTDEEAPAPVRVLLLGFGLKGQHLARVLREAQVRYRIVDLDARAVSLAKARDEPILFGDASRSEILTAAGVREAQVIAVTLTDPTSASLVVKNVRRLNPSAFLTARSLRLQGIEALREAGADLVIADELEASIELVTAILRRLHFPGNVVRSQARLLRADGYQMLRHPTLDSSLSPAMIEALGAGTSDSFLVKADHEACGRSLGELELRRRSGATVVAVLRGDQGIPSPGADLVLSAGDVLVVVGGHAQVEAAFAALTRPVSDTASVHERAERDAS